RGSLTLIGSYKDRGELTATERSITTNNDYTAFGGPNNESYECNPGNVFSLDGVTPLPGLGTATFAAVPAGFTGTPTIAEFQHTAGTLNHCSAEQGASLIPRTRRFGAVAAGNLELTPQVEFFAQLLYSHIEEFGFFGYQGLFGSPDFQLFSVSATNPYNPFHTDVGIAELFTTIPRVEGINDTTFVQPLAGVRGALLDHWQWEAAAWESAEFTHAPGPLNN